MVLDAASYFGANAHSPKNQSNARLFWKQAQRRACWNRVADSSNFAAERKNRFVKRRRSISPENENLRAHE